MWLLGKLKHPASDAGGHSLQPTQAGQEMTGDQKDEKELVDFVFSWSAHDILNEDLFKEKVKKIPEKFESIKTYYGSYIYPLMEETRAELSASLEELRKAPVQEILSMQLAKPKKRIYHISTEPVRNVSDGYGSKGPYIPKGGDIFAFSDVIPSAVDDLKQDGPSFILGFVQKNEDDENGPPPFQITAIVPRHFEAPAGNKSVFAVFLSSLTTNKRIWAALHSDSKIDPGIIGKVLHTNSWTEGSCNICYAGEFEKESKYLMEKTRKRLAFSKLNESQIEAVMSSFVASQCKHEKHSLQLVWGPPGTGKTNTIGTLLHVLLASKCRVLTCAPTNVAVAEVASRLLKFAKKPFGYGGEIFRLGDIVLMGNEERMNITDDLRDIFLAERVKLLVGCFAPATGWRNQLRSMIDFLEDCASEHDMYLENEKAKGGG
ncbi:hypothetical protein ACLOJK_017249 [Asimina triloba]